MKKIVKLTESDLTRIVKRVMNESNLGKLGQKILKEDEGYNITNQEVYDNGEIEERIYSHENEDGIDVYDYVIYYEGKYYEIKVSDDGINTEVENPNDDALGY